MVGDTLSAGEHRVVIGQRHAAGGVFAELVGIDGADAVDQAVGRAHLQQLFVGAASALGGEGKAAVFDKAAVVEQVGEVLAGGTLTGLTALGDGVRAALVGQLGAALQHFLQVGADMVDGDGLFILLGVARHFGRLQIEQGAAFEQAVTGVGGQRADDAALGRLDHELHFHGFHDRDLLADGDAVANLYIQTDQHALYRRIQRLGAGRSVGLRAAGGGATCAALEETVRVGAGVGGGQAGGFGFDKGGGDVVALHLRVLQQVLQQMQVAGGALQTEFAQRTVGAAQGVRVITVCVHDQLGH